MFLSKRVIRSAARSAKYDDEGGWSHPCLRYDPAHHPGMFAATEDDAAAIRAAFNQSGDLATAVELRRRFPCLTDSMQAREWARTIAAGIRCPCCDVQ